MSIEVLGRTTGGGTVMATKAAESGEEAGLLDAWRGGDPDALALLYQRYAPSLRAFCTHRLGNAVDADDAVHDTFLKAHAAVTGFEPGARLWPWLVTIAGNVCTDALRRRGRYVGLESLRHAVAPDLDEAISSRVRVAVVGDALRDLPPRYRVPVYLKHIAGSTYDEIARLQGRSVASVRSLVMRGRRNLGSKIEAVARSERQWPLPGTLPVVDRVRARLRLGRATRNRVVHSAQQWLALPVGWFASGTAGMQGAAAAVAALAPVAAVAAPLVETTDPSAAASTRPAVEAHAGVSASVWLPDVDDVASAAAAGLNGDFNHRIAGFDGHAPLPDGRRVSVHVALRAQREREYFYLEHDVFATGPAPIGKRNLSGGSRVPCEVDETWRSLCETLTAASTTPPPTSHQVD